MAAPAFLHLLVLYELLHQSEVVLPSLEMVQLWLDLVKDHPGQRVVQNDFNLGVVLEWNTRLLCFYGELQDQYYHFGVCAVVPNRVGKELHFHFDGRPELWSGDSLRITAVSQILDIPGIYGPLESSLRDQVTEHWFSYEICSCWGLKVDENCRKVQNHCLTALAYLMSCPECLLFAWGPAIPLPQHYLQGKLLLEVGAQLEVGADLLQLGSAASPCFLLG